MIEINGLDLNERSSATGQTVLHIAGSRTIYDLLVAAGAVAQRDASGKMPKYSRQARQALTGPGRAPGTARTA